MWQYSGLARYHRTKAGSSGLLSGRSGLLSGLKRVDLTSSGPDYPRRTTRSHSPSACHPPDLPVTTDDDLPTDHDPSGPDSAPCGNSAPGVAARGVVGTEGRSPGGSPFGLDQSTDLTAGEAPTPTGVGLLWDEGKGSHGHEACGAATVQKMPTLCPDGVFHPSPGEKPDPRLTRMAEAVPEAEIISLRPRGRVHFPPLRPPGLSAPPARPLLGLAHAQLTLTSALNMLTNPDPLKRDLAPMVDFLLHVVRSLAHRCRSSMFLRTAPIFRERTETLVHELCQFLDGLGVAVDFPQTRVRDEWLEELFLAEKRLFIACWSICYCLLRISASGVRKIDSLFVVPVSRGSSVSCIICSAVGEDKIITEIFIAVGEDNQRSRCRLFVFVSLLVHLSAGVFLFGRSVWGWVGV